MAKQTVYIPVEFNTATEIETKQAIAIANSIVSQIDANYFNSDNVYDEASEVTGDYSMLIDFTVKEPVASIETSQNV